MADLFDKPVKKLFLLDGMALAYRAHFGLIRNPRITSTGMNTSMVFAFANTLIDILHNAKPTHLAVVFDTSAPTHRHKEFKEYKAQREAMPDDIRIGLPYLDRLCDGFNLHVVKKDGWEADDLIGALAKQAEKEDFSTFMVTPDKDFGQLVSEKTVICKPGRTGAGLEILGIPEILEQWQIKRVDQVVDVLGLMGDTSDNIPGVPGIGPKTAKKLIAEYDTVENLLEHLDDLKGKQKQNLEENREQALLSKWLVRIVTDIETEVGPSDLNVREPDRQKLTDLFQELEFSALGKRLFGDDFEAAPQRAVAAAAATDDDETEPAVAADDFKTISDVDHTYDLADTSAKRKKLVAQLKKTHSLAFDLETSGLDPKTCSIVGLAFSTKAHTGTYVPFPDDRDEALAILHEFDDVFANPKLEKVGHNIKFDLTVFRWYGYPVAGPYHDTMLAAHVAVPDLRRNLDYLSQALLGYKPRPIAELIGERGKEHRSMRDVPLEEIKEYAVEDADVALQLWTDLLPKVVEMNQEEVLYKVEIPLVPVLVEMEYQGIKLDPDVLADISKSLQHEIETTRDRIFELAGEEFNLNSPKQLGEVFFERMQLDPNARRTKKSKQYQTNERVLVRLANKHEIAARVLHYRESTKLKSTYVDMLPGAVFKQTGHIHTHYEQAVAVTGRMQSSNPNLQNIPIRSDQGREIRKAFVARDKDHLLFSADYSQIELRIAAELSKDPALIEAFETEADIHNQTAMKIFGVTEEKGVTAEMRRRSKTVNFGIVYGMSAFGLAERLDIPRGEAVEIIENYFTQYAGIRQYMDEIVEFAREKGYVETITGRRRYLRDINARNASVRNGAERNAINSPVQGSAADMIKIAMTNIHNRMIKEKLRSHMLLQVHDELVFDMHKDEADVLPPLVTEEMKSAIQLSVPIVVESGVGENWLDAH